jgi:hypothetical protein
MNSSTRQGANEAATRLFGVFRGNAATEEERCTSNLKELHKSREMLPMRSDGQSVREAGDLSFNEHLLSSIQLYKVSGLGER